ncbi:hypothetical protein PO909_009858 [Leuciscus waleckii]
MSQHTTFNNVLNEINNFLSIYQTETVLVRVKHNDEIPNQVISQLKQNTKNWVDKKIPRMKEVRGKIVFIQKNTFRLGLPLHETDVKACKVNTAVLNYSSGTGWPVGQPLKTPKNVAKKINPWLYNNLEGAFKQNFNGCFGIIAMDFPGFDLIQMVINFNK